MHPKTRNTTREITKLLLMIVGSGVAISAAALLGAAGPQSRRAQQTLVSEIHRYARGRIRETLNRLRMQRHISFNPDDARSPILLTKKGVVRMLRTGLFHHLRARKRRWDYLWRMIIFDVPEENKSVRERLRMTLQAAGFFPLQRSVFVTPYACEKEVEALCEEWQLRHCAHVFLTASLGSAERRARMFFSRQGVTLRKGKHSSVVA